MKTLILNHYAPLFFLATALLASCEVDDDTPSAPTGEELVDVGGYQLYVRSSGSGSPAIVLITGLAGTTDDWKVMEEDFAEVATVINYDREGLGRSDWNNRPKDSETIAEELHALLKKKNIEPPYLLAAHSLGGIHARVFTSLYPDEVAGLLLVDPTPENLIDSLLAPYPPDVQEAIREGARQEQEEALMQLPEGGLKEEVKAIETWYGQARALTFTTSAPVAVISSMKAATAEEQASVTVARMLRDELLEQMCSGPRKHYTTQAGHFVQKEQPALVMEAVSWVLANAQ